jgi:hypothetical protein
MYLFICNRNWVDTRWQQYSTHLYTNGTQNTENGTYVTIKKYGKCRPCPVFASYTLAFALQPRKKHGETSVRVVESAPIFRWQQYSTHLHTNGTQNNTVKQNTQSGTYITLRILKLTKEHVT